MPLYEGTHTDKVRLMIDQLLDNPDDFIDQCKWYVSRFTYFD